MKNWTIKDGESSRVYLVDSGRDAIGEIVYAETRNPADARLIAAAPDLLAALMETIETMKEHGLTPPASAHAAIKRAEGKS